MKKTILLSAINLLLVINVFAQEHQSFKGIPLNGTIDEFSEKLESKGFTITEKDGNMISLSGSFINKSCDVFVLGSKKSNVVWKVVVFLPKEILWRDLKSEYKRIKEIYQRKYGEGKSYEFFSDPYYEGDNYELQALKKKKCTYVTYFETERGYINVELASSGFVKIGYEDAINVKINSKEKEEIVNDDI